MITGSYHVFGSGSAWVCWSGDAEEILRFVASAEFKATRRNAGHNGFIGYYEVPDEIVPAGISTDPGAYPGGGGRTGRTMDGVRMEVMEKRGFPRALAGILSRLWGNEQALNGTLDDARVEIRRSWIAGHLVVEAVGAGELGAEWLPDTSRLYGFPVMPFADGCYKRGVNPLPVLRKVLPEFTWEFHREEVQSTPHCRGHDYRRGDVIVWPTHGGWISATCNVDLYVY